MNFKTEKQQQTQCVCVCMESIIQSMMMINTIFRMNNEQRNQKKMLIRIGPANGKCYCLCVCIVSHISYGSKEKNENHENDYQCNDCLCVCVCVIHKGLEMIILIYCNIYFQFCM